MRRSPRKAIDQAYFADLSIPEPNSGCWLWLGATANKGYGQITLDGGMKTSAHRASYVVHNDSLPPDFENLDVDHTCRNPACVNPDHLEAVTHLENCRRRNAGQLCREGHELDGVRNRRDGRSERYCKQCESAKRNQRRPTRRAEVNHV